MLKFGTGVRNDDPCAKKGRYSVKDRWNSCGAIVVWSASTFEKSGPSAPTNASVRVTGTVASSPTWRTVSREKTVGVVSKTLRSPPVLARPYTSAYGGGRLAPPMMRRFASVGQREGLQYSVAEPFCWQ